ncbi:hypothetical protein PT974_07712 [Cladobotryum mycophilum]|uniref:BZIP domain-containing protein n=1 Tax=Cladobotryum mycophilum TaxID=491253 RepID=A0ABR0SHN3_9HYPO
MEERADAVQAATSENAVSRRRRQQVRMKPVSEDRRMQNRRAQKAYRDRKREKLRELERKVATFETVNAAESQAPLSGTTPPSASRLLTDLDPLFASSSQQQSLALLPNAIDNPDGEFAGNNAGIWFNLDSPITAMSPITDREFMIPNMDAPDQDEACLDNSTLGYSYACPDDPLETSTVELMHNMSSEQSSYTELSNMASDSCRPNTKDIQLYRPSGKSFSAKPRTIRELFLSLSPEVQAKLHKLAKSGDFHFIDIIQSVLENSSQLSLSALVSPMIQPLLADASYSPYRNSLHIARFSYFSALFANFSSLGFNFSLFLDENSTSPFYKQSDLNTDDFPPSLRPLPSQLTVPHHPYIDTLPFPVFRHRLLAALAADPLWSMRTASA